MTSACRIDEVIIMNGKENLKRMRSIEKNSPRTAPHTQNTHTLMYSNIDVSGLKKLHNNIRSGNENTDNERTNAPKCPTAARRKQQEKGGKGNGKGQGS